MQKSLRNIFSGSYILILLGVISLIATNFLSVYLVNKNNEDFNQNILPKKETYKEYTSKINELELLWEQRSFEVDHFEKLNRLKSLTEVELPRLNKEVFYTIEELPDTSELFLNGKQIIYEGENLQRLCKKYLVSKRKSKHRSKKFNKTIKNLKNKLAEQNIYLVKEEALLKENLDASILYVLIFAGFVSVLSVILIVQSISNQYKYILYPLKDFTAKISNYSKDNYGQDIQFGEVKEFIQLCEAFNKMSNSLSENFKTINSTNDELKQLTKNLKDTNEQLEEFVYIASHDLKTPIRGMSNLALFLKEDYEDKLDDEGVDMLTKIEQNAKKMHTLIEDLLHYSRISKTELRKEEMSLNNIITDVCEFLDLAENPNIKVNVGELINIVGDKSKIQSVFNNLFTNSLKYNRSDVIKIDIWCVGSTVFFKDNGIGIDEKDFDKVFAFFRRSHVEDFEGTGAGMAIAKKILDRHGASIQISSKVDVGTVFIIDFEKAAVD